MRRAERNNYDRENYIARSSNHQQNTAMIIGTSHFPSFRDACLYYLPYVNNYDEAVELVRVKLNEQEICLDKPRLQDGEACFVKENRWHIRK